MFTGALTPIDLFGVGKITQHPSDGFTQSSINLHLSVKNSKYVVDIVIKKTVAQIFSVLKCG